jgi:hypothetical protein
VNDATFIYEHNSGDVYNLCEGGEILKNY